MSVLRYMEHDNLTFRAHAHPSYEIICVFEGEMAVTVNNSNVELQKGEGVFIPPFFIHAFRTDDVSKCGIWEFSQEIIKDKFLKNLLKVSISEMIFEIIGDMTKKKNVLAEKAVIYLFASTFLENGVGIKTSVTNDICREAIIYIMENFRNPITLKDVARHCNVNYSYLSRLFFENEGVPFTTLLNAVRIDNAISLIADTDKSMTEIAFECGFGSIRNFNRIFMDSMKMTPSEFRKKQI